MKALEVLVNGEVVGLYVPPDGECFGVVLGNVPRTYMRAQVSAGDNNPGVRSQFLLILAVTLF